MHVTPPPLLYEAFGGNMEKLVYWMSRLSEEATQRVRTTRTRPALGARAVTRLHPWSEPGSLRGIRFTAECSDTGRIASPFCAWRRRVSGRSECLIALNERELDDLLDAIAVETGPKPGHRRRPRVH